MRHTTTFQDSVPLNYDQYMGPIFFEPFAADLAARLNSTKAQNVLELACGTGRLTKHLLPLINTNGTLYATDLNEEMLAVAKEKIQDERICWQVVDAQELPYADQTFDLVVCQFGVMFFLDKLQAFKEALRVLQPDGNFIFLTWDDVVCNTISLKTQSVLQTVFTEDPPVFSQKGPYSYFDKNQIQSSLKEAGFRNIEIIPVALTSEVTNINDVLTGILDGSPLATFLHGRDTEKAKVRELLKQELSSAEHKHNGKIEFPMQALYCKSMK